MHQKAAAKKEDKGIKRSQTRGSRSQELVHNLVHDKVQSRPKTHAPQQFSALIMAAWHAGGQRFESAWLHPVRPLAPQGVFFVGQGVAGRRAMALHCSSSWLIRASSSGKLGNSPRSIPESAMAV